MTMNSAADPARSAYGAGKVATIAVTGIVAGLALGVATLGGVLAAQVSSAKRRPMVDPRTAPEVGGSGGTDSATRIKFALLGDSLAISVGTHKVEDSLGGRIGQGIVNAGYKVDVTSVAVANSRTSDVRIQVSRALITSEDDPYDVALIVVGSLDATSWGSISEVSRAMLRAVSSLRSGGVQVVVATAPDLGAVHCVGAPLRTLWSWRSHKIAAAQASAAEDAGATVINLAEELGPLFRADPGTICPDGFHPSSDGYRLIAERLIPAVRSACERSTKSRA